MFSPNDKSSSFLDSRLWFHQNHCFLNCFSFDFVHCTWKAYLRNDSFTAVCQPNNLSRLVILLLRQLF